MLPTHDASKVKARGPGLNTTGVPASLPVEFTIDAKDAGEGLLAVQITVSWPRGRRRARAGATGVRCGARSRGQIGRFGSLLPPELCRQEQVPCP